jgi:NDP-sugar pyrophosphorylase family protein
MSLPGRVGNNRFPGEGHLTELGAIVVVGPQNSTPGHASCDRPGSELSPEADQAVVVEGSLACVEILGRSVLERTIERLCRMGVQVISVVMDEASSNLSAFHRPLNHATLQLTAEPWAAAARMLGQYAERGIETALVAGLGGYVEFDAEEMFEFHRQQRQASTRAFHGQRALDLWVVDSKRSENSRGKFDFWALPATRTAAYPLDGYVNPLAHARDLRRLVVDALQRRCQLSPVGREIKPRVWVDDGARLHRRARVIAPAYIGRASSVREDTLITRFSNLESFCQVDYGTVIEDSSVLSNSYVGIWLDVSHAVVCGSKLLNLSRNRTLNLADASMLRRNIAVRKDKDKDADKDISREIPVEVAGATFRSLSRRSEMGNR